MTSNLDIVDLTEATREQLTEVLRWRNHPDVRQWMVTRGEIDLATHLQFIESRKAKKNSERHWRVGDLGVISLKGFSPSDKTASLGIYANIDNPRSGKGAILLNELLRLGFEELHLDEIHLEVYKTNTRAVALYEKAGFKHCGEITTDPQGPMFKMSMVRSNFIYRHPEA